LRPSGGACAGVVVTLTGECQGPADLDAVCYTDCYRSRDWRKPLVAGKLHAREWGATPALVRLSVAGV